MTNATAPAIPTLLRDSTTPMHQLIERWFIDAISSGEIAPGDKLPSEPDLATSFGVSRMTLRQALTGLQSRGLLERVPGRAGGTFVLEPKVECDLTGLTGFTEQMQRAERKATAKVVSAQQVSANRLVADALNLEREAPVFEVVRVRSANRQVLALERSYFPADALPGFLEQRLTGSLYRLLTRKYGHTPSTAIEYLEPATVTEADSGLLDMAAGSAVMLIERTASTAAGMPIEFARDLFRPDRIRISVRSGLS